MAMQSGAICRFCDENFANDIDNVKNENEFIPYLKYNGTQCVNIFGRYLNFIRYNLNLYENLH